MHNDTCSTSLLSFTLLTWNFFDFTDYQNRSSKKGFCMYASNFKKGSSRVRACFIGMFFLCACTTSVIEFSHLLLFEGIDVIWAGGSLRSSRDVSAAISSVSLAIISYSTCDDGYIVLFDVLQPRVEHSSLQL